MKVTLSLRMVLVKLIQHQGLFWLKWNQVVDEKKVKIKKSKHKVRSKEIESMPEEVERGLLERDYQLGNDAFSTFDHVVGYCASCDKDEVEEEHFEEVEEEYDKDHSSLAEEVEVVKGDPLCDEEFTVDSELVDDEHGEDGNDIDMNVVNTNLNDTKVDKACPLCMSVRNADINAKFVTRKLLHRRFLI